MKKAILCIVARHLPAEALKPKDSFYLPLKNLKKDLPQTIKRCVRQGVEEFLVLNCANLTAKQRRDSIPEMLSACKQAYPEIDFHFV